MKTIILLLFSQLTFARTPIFYQDANTGQFLPSIIMAILGNGYALVPSKAFFGDCSDGDVTISSGTTTLSRDMFYNNLTITGGQISFQNQRIFVCGTLDLSTAPAFSLDGSGNSGNAGGNGGTHGNGGQTTAVGTNITGKAGGNGGDGSTTTGAQGAVGGSGLSITSSAGGSGGAGGAGASGAGGAQRGQAAITAWPMRDITYWFTPQSGSGGQVFVGGGGSGGGGGGGDLTTSGGGGGGGGASGQTVYIAAHIIKTSGSSVGATITAWGGQGGAGGSPTAGNAGGGGGGGGGAGGWIVIKYDKKIGNAVTSLVSAPYGAFGSVGGTGHGTGVNGSNGNATPGQNGLIQILNLSTGAMTTSTTGAANL